MIMPSNCACLISKRNHCVLEKNSASMPKIFFEASQTLRIRLSQQIEEINHQSSELSTWQGALDRILNEYQPVLSIIRYALARSQADMISADQDNGGTAQLSEQEHSVLNEFFKKNPQKISGFSSGDELSVFPNQSSGLNQYCYSETDLMVVNAFLQQQNDFFSDQIQSLQVLFQIIIQSYTADLEVNLNFLDYANATYKTLFSQFS